MLHNNFENLKCSNWYFRCTGWNRNNLKIAFYEQIYLIFKPQTFVVIKYFMRSIKWKYSVNDITKWQQADHRKVSQIKNKPNT